MVVRALLILFIGSLPWLWMDLGGSSQFAIRPSIATGLLLTLYLLGRKSYGFPRSHFLMLLFFMLSIFIWLMPSLLYRSPHWSSSKVLSLFAYAAVSYYPARAFVSEWRNSQGQKFWWILLIVMIGSCLASFYLAFGTLLPDTRITDSTQFIHGSLYGLSLIHI